jgi:uncharacterized protein (TIGR02117 family)
MYKFTTLLFVFAILLFLSTAANSNSVTSVFVVQSRWHTGIILQTKDINPQLWPEIRDYAHKTYIDVGWGDEKFYQANGSPIHLAARAILWPTQSILQIDAFSISIKSIFGAESRILEIPVNKNQLNQLTSFIANNYKRDKHQQPQLSTYNQTNTRFYLATKKYHLFRTCNTWVAMAFKYADFNVSACTVINANQLFRQLKRIEGVMFIE